MMGHLVHRAASLILGLRNSWALDPIGHRYEYLPRLPHKKKSIRSLVPMSLGRFRPNCLTLVKIKAITIDHPNLRNGTQVKVELERIAAVGDQ